MPKKFTLNNSGGYGCTINGNHFFEFTGDESANIPGDSDVITIQMDPVGPPDYDSDTLIVHFADAVTGQPLADVGGFLMSNVGNDWNGSWSTTF